MTEEQRRLSAFAHLKDTDFHQILTGRQRRYDEQLRTSREDTAWLQGRSQEIADLLNEIETANDRLMKMSEGAAKRLRF